MLNLWGCVGVRKLLGILSRFYSAKQDYSIEFPHLDDEPQDELLARIECGDFVREIINEPAQTLTPVKLAERAAEFISKQAENYADKSAVSFQIISGEALKEQGYHGSLLWVVVLLIRQLCCN